MTKFWDTVRKPWVAQIALAAAVAWSIANEHTDAQDGRDAVSAQATAQSKAVAALAAQQSAEVAASTKRTLVGSCTHGNDLRTVLRGLIAQEIPAVKRAVKKGQITPSDGQRDLHQVKLDLEKVKNVNCTATYAKIH